MLVIHSMRGGGAERQMSYLANELAPRCETSLVTLDAAGNDGYSIDQRIRRIGLGMTSARGGFVRGALANWERIRAIRKTAEALAPECIISFCDKTNILTSLACGARFPVILSERSDPRKQRLSGLWERLRKIAYARAAVCIAQTDDVRDYLASQIARRSTKTKWLTIPSAVFIPEMDWNALTMARHSQSPQRVLFVGRLSPEKRVDRLLNAWSQLGLFHGAWKLAIVGDGPERASLRALAEQLQLGETVQWLGWKENVWAELAASHIFVLTSEYEGYPQAMLEGMASGLPAVVFDCSPAIRDAITDQTNGWIVSSQASFQEALATLLQSESQRIAMGEQAWKRARDFQWSRLAPKWNEAIRLAT